MSVTATIDHVALGLSRVATQYLAADRFIAYLRALLQPANEIETALFQLASLNDIDTAAGVHLDTLGEIVGISRIIPGGISIAFFDFEDGEAPLPMGEEGNLAIGGRFYGEDEPTTATTVLSDPEYRLLIRAKIVKNHSKGTNDDVALGLSYIFDGVPTVVDDPGGMEIRLAIGRRLTALERALIFDLDLLPRPAGVRIRVISTFVAGGYFGFSSQPGALGFSEEATSVLLMDGSFLMDGSETMGSYTGGAPVGGGVFAEEFTV